MQYSQGTCLWLSWVFGQRLYPEGLGSLTAYPIWKEMLFKKGFSGLERETDT